MASNKRRKTAAQVATLFMSAHDSDIELDDDSDFEFSSSDIESESETDGAVSDTHGADTSVVTSDDASVVTPTAKTTDTSSTRRKRPSKKDTADEFIWTSDVSVPTADFTETSGFRNLPANLTNDSKSLDFLELFLDSDIIQLMVD